MEDLYSTYRLLLDRTPLAFRRFLHSRINWKSRLVAILGARGVGKSTLMLQHIKLEENVDDALYVLADDFYFTTHRLYELALNFYQHGGKALFIDEIHKYKGWSVELKNIYDKLPDLRIVYSGSSILDLEKGGADLSRRKVEYHLPGLSFREYVNLSQGSQLPEYAMDDILQGKVEYPSDMEKPLKLFQQYLSEGYYPIFLEGDYRQRLQGVLKQMVDEDIPNYAEMTYPSRAKLKRLLYVLAQTVPFKPNFSKLEKDLGISRNVLPDYMDFLEKAGLLLSLRDKAKGMKVMEKVEKLYLQNPNLAYALSETPPDIGSVRETIFLAWTKPFFAVTASPVSDFEIDGRTFEIGGKNKGRKQLQDAAEGYVVKDNIEYAFRDTIPLWHFGFLY